MKGQLNVADAAFVERRDFDFAGHVLHVGCVEGVELRGEVGGEDYGLAQVAGVVVEVVLADAGEVGVGGVAGLLVQVGEGGGDVVEVLHEHCVCLVDYEDLDRGEGVVVLLFGTARSSATVLI